MSGNNQTSSAHLHKILDTSAHSSYANGFSPVKFAETLFNQPKLLDAIGVSPAAPASARAHLNVRNSRPMFSYRNAGITGKTSAAFLIAAILATIPVWIPTFPPMTDLPQHAAQIATISRYWDPSYPFSNLYETNWFTPYLFGYGLVWIFATLLPIITACKIVVSLAVLGFLLAASWLRRTVGGRKEWDWLFLPIPYGFVYEWGFLNFFVGAPIVLLFVREAILLSRAPDRDHAIRLAVFAHLLFFAHVLLAVFFCFVLGLRAAALAPDFRTAYRRILPFVSPVPITLLWALLTLFGEAQAKSFVGWDWSPERFIEYFCLPFGLDTNSSNMLIGAALFIAPWISGGVPSRRLADWIPFIFISIILLLLPSLVFGNHFTYQRFGLFAYPLYLIAFIFPQSTDKDALPSSVRSYALLIAMAAAIAIHATDWLKAIEHEKDSNSFEAILDHMAPDKRALGIIFDRYSDHYHPPVYLHYAAWYPAVRGGAADFSFASFIPQILRYSSDTQPNWGRGSDWTPGLFHWRAYQAWKYDYFIVHAGTDFFSRKFFKRADCHVRLVKQVGDWWLYERLTGSASDKKSCATRYNLREHP